jgi:mono/diheme cytochrome c family protein
LKQLKLIIVLTAITGFIVACNNPGGSNSPAANNNGANANSPTPRTVTSPPPDPFASSREVYSKRCEVCHKADGTGGPVDIAGKKLKVPSLREGHALTHTDEQVVKQISNGGGGMPPFKKLLTPDEINQLAQFIRQDIQKSEGPAPKSVK